MRKTVLENGIRVLTDPLPSTRTLSMGILVCGGLRDERPESRGLAHLAEHMFFHGTSSRAASQIARTMDRLGGQIGAYTARDYTSFHATVLDDHATYALDLLSDLLLNSTFPVERLEREQQAIQSEIAMADDDPMQRTCDLIKAQVWPGHVLGRPIAGEPQSVASFTRDDLIYFVHENYLPDRMIVAAAGNVEHADFVAHVRDGFWRFQGESRPHFDAPPTWTPGAVLEHRPLSQAYFAIAVPAPPYAHADRFATHVLASLLGGGLSSRLFRTLREKRGLVYDVSADYLAYREAGMLLLTGSAPPEQLQTVLELTLAELWGLAENPADMEDELWNVRQQLSAQHLLVSENAHTRMGRLATQEFYFGKSFASEEILSAILAIDEPALGAFCRRALGGSLSDAAIAVVGPDAPSHYSLEGCEQLLKSFSPFPSVATTDAAGTNVTESSGEARPFPLPAVACLT